MIHTIGHLMTGFFDLLLTPVRFLGEAAQIIFTGLISALIILFFFGKLSSTEKKKRAKDQIKANIFAIRIYRDFWRVIVISFFKSIFHTLRYFTYNFAPVLVFLPLLFLFSVQMDVRFGMRSPRPGEPVMVSVNLTESPREIPVQLLESDWWTFDMPPVVIDSFDEEGEILKEVNWRIRPRTEGEGSLVFQVGDREVSKSLVVGDEWEHPLSVKRLSSNSSLFSKLLYPVEPILTPGGAVNHIALQYPPDKVSVLFLRLHWLVVYIVSIFFFALLLRKRFGVEF